MVTAMLTFRDYSDIKSCTLRDGGGVWRAGETQALMQMSSLTSISKSNYGKPLTSQAVAESRGVPAIGHGNRPVALGKEETIIFSCREAAFGEEPPPPAAPQTKVSSVQAALRDSVRKLTLLLACPRLKRPIAVLSLPPTAVSLICLQTRVCFRFFNVFFQSLRRYENEMSAGCLSAIECQLTERPSITNTVLMEMIIPETAAKLWLHQIHI